MDTYNNYNSRKKDWEDLEMTKEELTNLNECLKKEEFRKLLIEYAEEVNDPENKKVYEKEITQLEKERGIDVTFVNPEPGYVIKTSVNGERKCFLNISKSEIVARPASQPSYEQGHRGLQWSIPYTLIPPRDDLDKKNVRCMVFDVVFHPDTIYLASKNVRFREIVNNTAMDGVESNFKVKLDRKNVKFPKMAFKGSSHPAVIRKPSKEEPSSRKEQLDFEPEIYEKLMSAYDENRERQAAKLTEEKPRRNSPSSTTCYKSKGENATNGHGNNEYTNPKFSVKHQTNVEMEDFTMSKDAKMNATVPKKLIVIVDLPLLKNATDATLNVQECSLSLKSEKPAKYLLELPLPYKVNPDTGTAKFDPKSRKLTVTLPVIRTTVQATDAKEDSGVDSDRSSPISIAPDKSDILNPLLERAQFQEKREEIEIALINSKNDSEGKDMRDDIHNDLRTLPNNNFAEIEKFANPNVKYSLPSFNCNIYDNQLAITINVKNVDPTSISQRLLRDHAGIHILMTSIGAGCFPQYYSLCFQMKDNTVQPTRVKIEPWDNNVVVTITVKNPDNLTHYSVGLDEEFMEEKDFPTAALFKNKLKELMESPKLISESENEVQVQPKDQDVIIKIRPNTNQLDSDEDEDEGDMRRSMKEEQEGKHVIAKARSVSESSGDELASSAGSIGHSKGILKSRRIHNFSRSVSESSADENGALVSSTDYQYDSVHDIHSESDCSSLKKTVRFNDVVSRQLFRSNSSILGQRKKNQRKLRNKKRAQERRMSESENSETEDRDKYKSNKSIAEQEVFENVKPILTKDKQSHPQRTANIQIGSLRTARSKHSSSPRKCGIEEENTEQTTKAFDVTHVERTMRKGVVQPEFKNDLIFDLDM